MDAIGTIADVDDIAPQGTVITQAHVDAYRASVQAAHQGLDVVLWDD
jgi:hypothetical protein